MVFSAMTGVPMDSIGFESSSKGTYYFHILIRLILIGLLLQKNPRKGEK